jgi:hypothetical protein
MGDMADWDFDCGLNQLMDLGGCYELQLLKPRLPQIKINQEKERRRLKLRADFFKSL